MTGIREYDHSTNQYRKYNTAIARANTLYRAKKYINIITQSSFLLHFSLLALHEVSFFYSISTLLMVRYIVLKFFAHSYATY